MNHFYPLKMHLLMAYSTQVLSENKDPTLHFTLAVHTLKLELYEED